MKDIRGTILWWAAKRQIRRHGTKVVAIGGAIAKTSTKVAVGTLLKLRHPGEVRVGFGNLNSYLGVPLSILGFEIDFYEQKIGIFRWIWILKQTIWRGIFGHFPKYLVLEYGTDKPGDIAAITAQLPPDVGMITIVGPAHLANYPSVDDMVKDEGYLAERVKDDGILFVNSNDTYLTEHHRRTKARVVNVVTNLEEIAVKFMEALGRELSISAELIEEARDDFQVPAHRFEQQKVGPYYVLDDSYNSSPLAVKAALHLFKKLPAPRVAILGSMKELGQLSASFHQEIGDYAHAYADTLIAVGDEAREFGFDVWYPDAETAAAKIFADLPQTGSILVKGSHSVHMEKIVAALNQKYQPITQNK